MDRIYMAALNKDTNIVTRDTIKRLAKDVKDIIKTPLTDNGIYYVHDENDILKGYALIIGPPDTPYSGGYYFFKFQSTFFCCKHCHQDIFYLYSSY